MLSQRNFSNLNFLSIVVLVLSLFSLSACSSDIFDDDQDADVVSITIDGPNLSVGTVRRIVLNLDYSDDDVFSDGDDVAVALVLPNGIQFVVGSAEIDGVFGDDDQDAIIVPCPDGSTILFFNVDDDDLDGADDPSSRAEARLELDILGAAPTELAVIEARADYNSTNASCGFPLDAQASLIVSVS